MSNQQFKIKNSQIKLMNPFPLLFQLKLLITLSHYLPQS